MIVAHGLICSAACGILALRPGMETMSPALQGRLQELPWQIPPGSPQDSLASAVIPISKYSARNMLKHTTGCPTGSRGGPGMHSGLRYKWSQKCKCCQVSQMAHLFIWVSFSYTVYRLLPHSSRHNPLQPHLWRGCETPCLSS